MQTIKKYANRKLYHTNRKQYITLEGIADLIQEGEQVCVIDNESGEEITASILAQVLHRRGRKSVLPTHVLAGLLQTGNETLSGLRRSVWHTIGGADDVDREIERRLRRLHERGMVSEHDAARILYLLCNEPMQTEGQAQAGEIARLNAQVDALAAVVEQLVRERQRP